jgi:hypothetical protein
MADAARYHLRPKTAEAMIVLMVMSVNSVHCIFTLVYET